MFVRILKEVCLEPQKIGNLQRKNDLLIRAELDHCFTF